MAAQQQLPDVLTLEEAAEYLRVSPELLRRKAREGLIPGVRIGRHWRFSRRQLLEWLESAAISDQLVEAGLLDVAGECMESEAESLLDWDEAKEQLGL